MILMGLLLHSLALGPFAFFGALLLFCRPVDHYSCHLGLMVFFFFLTLPILLSSPFFILLGFFCYWALLPKWSSTRMLLSFQKKIVMCVNYCESCVYIYIYIYIKWPNLSQIPRQHFVSHVGHKWTDLERMMKSKRFIKFRDEKQNFESLRTKNKFLWKFRDENNNLPKKKKKNPQSLSCPFYHENFHLVFFGWKVNKWLVLAFKNATKTYWIHFSIFQFVFILIPVTFLLCLIFSSHGITFWFGLWIFLEGFGPFGFSHRICLVVFPFLFIFYFLWDRSFLIKKF